MAPLERGPDVTPSPLRDCLLSHGWSLLAGRRVLVTPGGFQTVRVEPVWASRGGVILPEAMALGWAARKLAQNPQTDNQP